MTARHFTGLLAGFLALSGVLAPLPVGSTLSAAPAWGANLHQRTPPLVLAAFRAARAAGDWDVVRCNLDEDAVMISDNDVTNGADEIILELQALRTFFQGATPTVYSEIVVNVLGGNRSMVRQLHFIDTPCVDMPDGTDTYIIKAGQIAAITSHGFFVFSC
jgi:hypothetical protein